VESAGLAECAGYVLVGGRSSRMGCDKALLPWKGKPLAQWVAGAVAQSMLTATLVGAPERYSGLGFRVIPDLFPGEGPLGGILTALRDSQAEWNLIVACDMPGLDAQLLARLLQTARQSEAGVLLPIVRVGVDESRPQPLCAVYRKTCLAPLEAAFAQGTRKVTAALAAVRTVRVPMEMEEVPQFQNVNTPEDWSAYAAG
jgi:molybdopterin-guanine dinucleotide biosynthesis protein A